MPSSFPAFTLAHRALCAAAIFFRAAAERVRFPRMATNPSLTRGAPTTGAALEYLFRVEYYLRQSDRQRLLPLGPRNNITTRDLHLRVSETAP